jgi:glycosyltransferase involved in cell wall biosynthesis
MRIDVLHVLPDLAVGGAERIAVELLRRTTDARFATGVACLGAPRHSPLEAQLAADGIPVWFLDTPAGAGPRCVAQLHRLIRQCRPALLHTHLHVMPYVIPTLAATRTPRCVHTVHNLARHETRGLTRLAQRLAYRLGVTPVAISQAVRQSLRATYGLREVALIPNGIPVQAYAPTDAADDGARARVRAALELPADAVLFACFARLAPQKNHAGLLESFAAGPARDPRAHLLLCGDGPLRDTLEAQARALGLTRVRFLGERHDVPALLAAADAVVLASHWEGSPLTVMEAMAAARPVVATAVGGVPELLHHRRTGLLVPPRSPRALAAAMRQLLDDPALRQRLGNAAAHVARERFDASLMARRYQTLYDHLLRPRNAEKGVGSIFSEGSEKGVGSIFGGTHV